MQNYDSVNHWLHVPHAPSIFRTILATNSIQYRASPNAGPPNMSEGFSARIELNVYVHGF
jgi:hypothetical protein